MHLSLRSGHRDAIQSTQSHPSPCPQVNVNDEEMTLIGWHVPEGTFSRRANQPLCEVETSKSTGDVPAPASGILARGGRRRPDRRRRRGHRIHRPIHVSHRKVSRLTTGRCDRWFIRIIRNHWSGRRHRGSNRTGPVPWRRSELTSPPGARFAGPTSKNIWPIIPRYQNRRRPHPPATSEPLPPALKSNRPRRRRPLRPRMGHRSTSGHNASIDWPSPTSSWTCRWCVASPGWTHSARQGA